MRGHEGWPQAPGGRLILQHCEGRGCWGAGGLYHYCSSLVALGRWTSGLSRRLVGWGLWGGITLCCARAFPEVTQWVPPMTLVWAVT